MREGKKDNLTFFFFNNSKKAKIHPSDPKRQNNFHIIFKILILEI